jgi:hypothetical protein
MANPEHLAILKQGVAVWNEWREKNTDITANLAGADLKQVNLSGAILGGTGFFEADLTKANLREAELGQSFLNGANLTGADLTDAVLMSANLFEANLSGAILTRTDLTGANLNNTELKDTRVYTIQVGWTTFNNVDLSTIIGLETATHYGPSSVGIDTILRSAGNLPEVFLRGCGVPETFIEYSRSLIAKHIHYFTCMISYSSKDERFCKRFYNNLREKDVQVWRFAEDAEWGESVWGEIEKTIKNYDKVVAVCSKNSLTSGPVLREIERALNREDKEHKNVLFPVTLDDYIFDEWEHPRKADVLAKVVGDFRGWNRSATKYDAAFKKLLKALKAA